ncbi:MAG: GNAT family N-acetyltransferase [Pseudomonadota bacterium]
MSPEELAAFHARAFPMGARGWSKVEFAGLLERPGALLVATPEAFALGQVAAWEAELFLIATDPEARRAGHGAACLAEFEAKARAAGAKAVVLEVGAENAAARGLYAAAGYAEVGKRPGYYRRLEGRPEDALVMRKAIPALPVAT